MVDIAEDDPFSDTVPTDGFEDRIRAATAQLEDDVTSLKERLELTQDRQRLEEQLEDIRRQMVPIEEQLQDIRRQMVPMYPPEDLQETLVEKLENMLRELKHVGAIKAAPGESKSEFRF